MGGCHVAATLCGFVSLGLLLTSLGSDHWLEANLDEGGINSGLWKFCVKSSLGNFCDDMGMDVKSFIHATRAFMVMAQFPGFIACALLFVLFSRSKIGSYSIIRIIEICSHVAGVFALTALIIFTASYDSKTSYGWSAIVGWVGAALFLVTGLLARKAKMNE